MSYLSNMWPEVSRSAFTATASARCSFLVELLYLVFTTELWKNKPSVKYKFMNIRSDNKNLKFEILQMRLEVVQGECFSAGRNMTGPIGVSSRPSVSPETLL